MTLQLIKLKAWKIFAEGNITPLVSLLFLIISTIFFCLDLLDFIKTKNEFNISRKGVVYIVERKNINQYLFTVKYSFRNVNYLVTTKNAIVKEFDYGDSLNVLFSEKSPARAIVSIASEKYSFYKYLIVMTISVIIFIHSLLVRYNNKYHFLWGKVRDFFIPQTNEVLK